MRFTFDTNVLVYAFDRQQAGKHDHAVDLLDRSVALDVVILSQVITEFLNVALVRRSLPISSIAPIVQGWTEVFDIVVPNSALPHAILDLMRRHKLSVWDAALIATAEANGCGVVLSEDMGDGERYGKVRVLNPFAKANSRAIEQLFEG